MIKYANMRELKTETPKVMALAEDGNDVVITLRGKPKAILTRIDEDSLEEYILTRSPKFQKMLAAMDEDIAEGNYRSFRQYLKDAEKKDR
jgi:prevent-host-death family protein